MLRVRLRVRFDLLENTRKERDPVAHFWVSQTVSSDFYERKLEEHCVVDLDEQFKVSPPTPDLPSQNLVELIQAANLNCDLWSHLSNKVGDSGLNQCGSVKVPLYQLLSMGGNPITIKITIPSWGDPSGQRQDNTVDNDKGTMVIERASIELNGVSVPPPPPRLVHLYGKIEAFKQQTFQHYIGSCVAMFRKMPATWPAAKNINAYVYQCRSGFLPAAAFLGNRTGGTGPAYFENAARQVLARDGLLLDRFDWLKDDRAPAMLGRVLTLAANLMAYIPDIVYLPSRADRKRFLRKPLESFDLARTRGAGDCEDLALEIVLEAAELMLLPKAGLSRALSQMQVLREMYVFCMSLGGVSSAEINGDYGQLKQMGAHMWAMMIWRQLWNHWWRQGNGSPQDRKQALGKPPGDQYVLVLEGTGFLEPEAVTRNILADERAQAILEASPGKPLAGMRKWFFYKRGQRSRFYQTVQVLFTNEYLLEARTNPQAERYVCFAACKPGNGSTPTVGIEFDQFVAAPRTGLLLWSEPAISQDEAACLRHAMRDQHPMPPLVWPGRPADSRATEERVRAALGTPLRAGGFDVEYFAKPSMLSQERVLKLAQACRESGIIDGVSVCSFEAASKTLQAYRMRFHCTLKDPEALATILRSKLQAKETNESEEAEAEEDEDF